MSNSGKVVFVTAAPAYLNKQVIEAIPDGLNVVMVPNQASDDEKIDALKDADFILTFFGTLSERVLRHALKVRLLQHLSAGYETVDIGLLRRLGLSCATCGELIGPVVAEYTIMLALAFSRRVWLANATVKAGGWRAELPFDPSLRFDLLGKRIGLVGFGNIGQNIAKRLRGFDCHVDYNKRTRLSELQEDALGVHYSELRDLLTNSDVVMLICPLTAETTHLISFNEFEVMKPSAIIVNTSRGAVIDEAALIDALKRGKIAGAALDVFEQEPPSSDNLLLQMDNVLVTPHVGGGSRDLTARMIPFAWKNIKTVWDGGQPKSVVSAQ